MDIERVNQVWATDVTYIPMSRGFVYLVAVMDWHSRKVLSWRVSNTMDVSFCVEALEETIAKHGRPEIFNTDRGSQFTSEAFTGVLKRNGIRISMDGKRSWMDNVFIERLWRSLKYEEVYLKAYDSVRSAKEGIGGWIDFYNTRRRHQRLDRSTPDFLSFSSLNFIYRGNFFFFFKIPPRFSFPCRYHFSLICVYAASRRGFLNSLSNSSPFSRMAQATDKRRSHTVRTDLQ